jgi:hypothetical protein
MIYHTWSLRCKLCPGEPNEIFKLKKGQSVATQNFYTYHFRIPHTRINKDPHSVHTSFHTKFRVFPILMIFRNIKFSHLNSLKIQETIFLQKLYVLRKGIALEIF